MRRLSRTQLANWTAEKHRRGELLIGREAINNPLAVNRGEGYQSFRTAREMVAALRKAVIEKRIRQAHEAELAEPGDPPTSAIQGVAEW